MEIEAKVRAVTGGGKEKGRRADKEGREGRREKDDVGREERGN